MENWSPEMIVVRDVFQAKYGKTNDLVELFLEAKRSFPEIGYSRILTDASGPFFTVIAEVEVDSLGVWEQRLSDVFSHPEFPTWFRRMEDLVVSGRREFYNIAS
jgi:hypothetical protein